MTGEYLFHRFNKLIVTYAVPASSEPSRYIKRVDCQVDTSDVGLEETLVQLMDDGREVVIAWVGKKLAPRKLSTARSRRNCTELSGVSSVLRIICTAKRYRFKQTIDHWFS